MRRSSHRFALPALLLVVVLAVAGCSSSNDPESWDDPAAEEVRANFLEACEEANGGEDGLSEENTPAFCECTFDDLRELYGDDPDDPEAQRTFEDFKDLDDDLRNADEDEPVPAFLQEIVDNCLDRVG